MSLISLKITNHNIVFCQVLNLTQSYISMKVPLFVSNVFHSPAARGGWMSYDLQTDLKLTFVYNTAILWQKGIDAVSEEEQVTGTVKT